MQSYPALFPIQGCCLYDELLFACDPPNKILCIHQESNLFLLEGVLVSSIVNLLKPESPEKGVTIERFSRSFWPVSMSVGGLFGLFIGTGGLSTL